MPELRSRTATHGRNAAGSRALWRATGMADSDFGKPMVAIANSFTQFVPGHVHLRDLGCLVADAVSEAGGIAREFNTIAVDDGIAMGHSGMLYSLPSREIISDSVEYMVNAHQADALVCISNCDKITPGMLNAAMRLDVPTVFVSGGPMEAGRALVVDGVAQAPTDLITAMSASADESVGEDALSEVERSACPTCGSRSGMFTANSMNCLTEALGLSLPGNGSTQATNAARRDLFVRAGHTVVELANRWYFQDDASALPRGIATREASCNAMALDIAMGGSTNTVLHILAASAEAELEFTLADIERISRATPYLCKVAPNSNYHMEDVHRAGGITAIMGELDRAGLLRRDVHTVHYPTLDAWLGRWAALGRPRRLALARGAGALPRRAGREAHHRTVLDGEHLVLAGHRPRSRLHPGGRGCLHRRGRAGRAARQPRRARRGDQGRRRRRGALGVPGPRRRAGGSGAGCLGDPQPRGHPRRRRRDPLRGPGRRTRHAGDAAPDLVPQGPRPGQELRADHRGRFSGGTGTSGLPVGHISPEAAGGGVIGPVQPGDQIRIDVRARRLELLVDEATLAERRAKTEASERPWQPADRARSVSKTLRAYASMATDASTGAVRHVS
jgi:dihydroxy-acid dehydratase